LMLENVDDPSPITIVATSSHVSGGSATFPDLCRPNGNEAGLLH
jgi:hypothetical protein